MLATATSSRRTASNNCERTNTLAHNDMIQTYFELQVLLLGRLLLPLLLPRGRALFLRRHRSRGTLSRPSAQAAVSCGRRDGARPRTCASLSAFFLAFSSSRAAFLTASLALHSAVSAGPATRFWFHSTATHSGCCHHGRRPGLSGQSGGGEDGRLKRETL